MWKAARDSVCLLCRSGVAARPRAAADLESRRLWTEQRAAFASIRGGRGGGRDGDRDRRPSRMVLSDRVARGPPSAGDKGDAGTDRGGGRSGSRRPRDQVDGPFGGMNRTTANIRPRPNERNATTGGGRDRKEGKGKKESRNFKALKMQRALTSIGYNERTRIKEKMQTIENFDQFPLLPVVKEAIKDYFGKGKEEEIEVSDIKPSPVQRLAIPALLGQPLIKTKPAPKKVKSDNGREEFLLAAETGSGKTLAYLIPTINALKEADIDNPLVQAYNERLAQEKARRGDEPVSKWIENFEPHPETARPRVVVLVPTAELVLQVTAAAKSLAHVAKIKVRPISSTFSPAKIQRNMYTHMGVDLIVATPHLLASMASSDPNILSRVTHLVIDEADSLLDRSFSPETTQIIDRTMPSLKQLILCSATIPRRLDNYLAERYPNTHRITTPNLHAIPRRVQLGVIDVTKDPYRNNKNLACADAIWSIGKEAAAKEQGLGHEGGAKPGEERFIDIKRIMVFVNEREKTQEVAEYLQSKGIDAIALHRDSPDHRQAEALAHFTSSERMKLPVPAAVAAEVAAEPGRVGEGRTPGLEKRQLLNTKVIVATDIASRGIDTLAVRHVVLYDVPHTTIDFIHRLGRAGRMGRRGRGIVLVGKDDRRDVVAEVKESMFMGQALV
ncbi:P-loop containing nucleoside triphosphate hydrolase protein [Naviculisporaceae sp. PSN 640]